MLGMHLLMGNNSKHSPAQLQPILLVNGVKILLVQER
jgi:hypothetical protein